MSVHLGRFILAAAALCSLAACDSNQPVELAPLAQAVAPQRAPAAYFAHDAAPVAATAAPAVQAQGAYDGPGVTESERRAEEWSMVDFEQSFSIEMNRLSQEQAERSQRATLALQSGIVQGPGCEGTEGQAAQECERSLL